MLIPYGHIGAPDSEVDAFNAWFAEQLADAPKAERYPMITGHCKGCGAPWAVHPLANANTKGANECRYCRLPR